MNENTKEALKKFAESVQQLAHATLTVIGIDTATYIVKEAENLKRALDKDETIP